MWKTQKNKMRENAHCDKTQKHDCDKILNSNCEKTWIMTIVNLWRRDFLKAILVKTFGHLDNIWDVLWAAFSILAMFLDATP